MFNGGLFFIRGWAFDVQCSTFIFSATFHIPTQTLPLERDIVLRERSLPLPPGDRVRGKITSGRGLFPRRAEHLHDLRVYFGGVAFVPFLVFPTAGLQPAFDIDLLALGQVFPADFP